MWIYSEKRRLQELFAQTPQFGGTGRVQIKNLYTVLYSSSAISNATHNMKGCHHRNLRWTSDGDRIHNSTKKLGIHQSHYQRHPRSLTIQVLNIRPSDGGHLPCDFMHLWRLEFESTEKDSQYNLCSPYWAGVFRRVIYKWLTHLKLRKLETAGEQVMSNVSKWCIKSQTCKLDPLPRTSS